jgi:hypothetical protein
MALGPEWWTTQNVLAVGTPADDYAAINQGQLKNLVSGAVAAMDSSWPDEGAGYDLHALVQSWLTPTNQTDDYAAVTLGQLKAVSVPVYDRLISVGLATAYPWNTANIPAPDDYALANIGQAKALFSFDLNGTLTHHLPASWLARYPMSGTGTGPDDDFDGDGLSNYWEYLHGKDPRDFYNGQTPTLQLVSGGGQWGAPGEVLAQPITVSVNNGALNAPVTFTVSSGGALFSQNGIPPWVNSLSVRSSSGSSPKVAQAYVKLSAAASNVSNITITAGKATLQTTATTYDPTVPMPTALQAVPTSPTTVQLSWTAGDATRATSIEISRDDGANWQLYDVAEPGVSSFQITGLTPDVEVSFRVLTGDKRKAMMQGNASLGTWDWLKGYAGLWGAAWEWSNYSLLPHEVTAPTPEFLSDPTARVKTLPVSVPQLYVESVDRADVRVGYDGFKELNTAYLTVEQDETCTFGSGALKDTEQSTITFVWNPQTYKQSSTHTGDPLVTTPGVIFAEEIVSDTVRKLTFKDAFWDYTSKITLSNPYTLNTFITNVESWVPAFTGNRTLVPNISFYPYYSNDNSARASIFLMESPPYSDDTDTYEITKFQYQWKVNSDENAVVVWDVRFTPADGSAVKHDIHSWATHGDRESPVFEIDPTALNSKKNGTYQVGQMPIELAVDSNNDGTINGADSAEKKLEVGKETIEKPGLIVYANDGDLDGDGVPDWVDGIKKFSDQDGGKIKDGKFQPMKVTLPGIGDLSKVEVRFVYDASDPANVSGDLASTKFKETEPRDDIGGVPAGHLRIWTKDASELRDSGQVNAQSTSDKGDFVPANEWIKANDLLAGQAKGTLYLEGIHPSFGDNWGTDRIKLKLRFNSGQEIDGDEVSYSVV